MKLGMREPSFKRSIKARTTGKAKRAIKKAVLPGYGKRGIGLSDAPKMVYRSTIGKYILL